MEVEPKPISWQAELDQAFHNTLDDGEMILRWVAVAEVIDKDGEKGLYTMTSPDLKAWESLGLLQFALAVETGSVNNGYEKVSEDDD